MNVGEVENPDAFDSDEKKSKSTSVDKGKNPEEPDQLRDLDEPIGDDGVNYDVYADDVNTVGEKPAKEAEMNFSAEDIRKRKKTEFFVNIKNADKIKRAEEKRNAAEEKRILNEARRTEKAAKRAEKAEAARRARKQKYDDTQEKNATKEVRAEAKHQRKVAASERRKARNAAIRHAIAHFFWHSWHKYVTIAFLIGLAILGYFTYRSFVYYHETIAPKEQKLTKAVEEAKKHEQTVKDFLAEIGKYYKNGEGDGYKDACKRAEELIAEAKENEDYESLFEYSTEYASFVVSKSGDADKSLELLNSVYSLAKTDVQKMTIYSKLMFAYSELGDEESYARFEKMLNELEIKESDSDDYKNGGLMHD